MTGLASITWYPLDTWIVVIGALCAASCALLGAFLVLRRMSMMGDAISHAVLPGLAIAFLVTGSRASVAMFVGAVIAGLLTAILTQWLHSLGRIDRGAAMGVTFTSLFAIGLILIERAADARHVDLDPGCVLYGAIELAPLSTVGATGIPVAVVTLGAVLVLNVIVVTLLYKELTLSSFDPELATTLGINARMMHYLLMTLVAVTTVAAFEAIGSILVIAMLIVPAAAAHLLTDRLLSMIITSVVFGVVSAAVGHVAAIAVPPALGFDGTITSGMMAVVAGLLFVAVLLGAPRHGIISRVVHRYRLGLRIAGEDALGLLYRLEEHGIDEGERRLASRLCDLLGLRRISASLAISGLARQGLVQRDGAHVHMTDAGRRRAGELVRSHRLWETFLVDELALPSDHVHETAMELEHVTTAAMRERLAATAGDPGVDPHGRPIPPDEADPAS